MKTLVLYILSLMGLLVTEDEKNHLNKIDLDKLKSETARIMNILGIEKRPNINSDSGNVRLRVNKSVIALSAKFTCQNPKDCVMAEGDNYKTRYYIAPIIEISPLVDLVISDKKDTSAMVKIKASSILVHELTHYLQSSEDRGYFMPENEDNMGKHIEQATEIEAWSVQSYYFLQRHQPKKLKTIMDSSKSIREKMKELIITFYSQCYPWRKKLVFS